MGNKKTTFPKQLLHYKEYLLMLSPAIVFFIVFSYIPMAGIIIAFKEYSYSGGIFGSPWVGLKNLRFILLNNDLFVVIRNTVGYNIAFIIVNNVSQIFCAVVLAELGNKIFKKVTQTVMLLPYFVSWVVVGGLTYNLLNFEHGFVNNMMSILGKQSIDFYNKPLYWIPIIIIISAWKSVGYGTVVYLATIMGIDSSLYEAAKVDGASKLQTIFRIVIPMLIPTMIILVLLSLGNIFRGDFSMFYQLIGNNAVLWPTTDVIDTFVTRALLQSNDIGMSSAAGFFQSVFGFITVIIANKSIKTYNKDYSLF